MQPATLSATDAATHLGLSERKFHGLRKDPAFPKPRLIGSRNRWLRDELNQWILELPVSARLPEPRQLSHSAKRRPTIEPKPELWPTPTSAGSFTGLTRDLKAVARARRLADQISSGKRVDEE